MPESSFHCHRLLRLQRPSPRLLKSPLAGPRNDTDVSHSPYLDSSPAVTSRLFSGSGALGDPVHPENSTGCPCVDRALNDFNDQSSQQATQMDDIGSTVAPMLRRQGSVTQQPAYLPRLPRFIDSTKPSLARPSQQSYVPEQQSHSSEYLPPQQHRSQGRSHQAHKFSATGSFRDVSVSSVMHVSPRSNQFMKELLRETIPGAAFDSSARDPPPRCHPGTRLAALKRCVDFVSNNDSGKRVRWIVGAAGVGKSAIMQNVAESPKPPGTMQASVFFSINGRNDGTKAVKTLSYQLAANSDAYRQVIEDEINCDPSVLRSSMQVQFEKFIVEPFIHHSQLSSGRVLIIIDGLDECHNPRTQYKLLRLISDFCISYPSSPIVWLIASRPESHITSFFSRAEVIPVYEKEEIPVDSDEARADVERFLRNALEEIDKASYSLNPEWPYEQDLWKLAYASGGLFAYAHTVVRYISDPTIGRPALQLSDVLDVIENYILTDIPPEDHPMALLDALYARILSKVPAEIMINTRKFLLALSSGWDLALPRRLWSYPGGDFIVLCNWLNMTRDEAYAAVNELCSVLRVPRPDKAHSEPLKALHKSFMDYISDFSRSGFSPDILDEARQLKARCAFRILKQAPEGINFGGVDFETYGGVLARGPGSGDKISFSWLDDKDVSGNSHRTRLSVYKLAIGEVVFGVKRGDPNFQNMFCIHLLKTRFQTCYGYFPLNELRDLVFDESRYHEFMIHGILKKIPLRAVGISNIFLKVKLQFRRPAMAVAKLSDPWDLSCTHKRVGEWEEGKDQSWVTFFPVHECGFCYSRLAHQLGSLKIRSPDRAVPILFTSTGRCCVEFRFVDEKDGMSEWRYWFWCILTE